MGAFEILGIAPNFTLDVKELSARQRELSRALHPDQFVGRPAGERRIALGKAIEVNEAARLLKNALTRGEVLLRRLSLFRGEGNEVPASPVLLMSMMEKREDLREAARQSDISVINRLQAEMKLEESQVLGELSADFQAALSFAAEVGDSSLEDSQAQAIRAESLHKNLGALRYYRRFFDEADALLDEIS